MGGTSFNEGRVEVRVKCNSNWGTVCDDYWGTTDALIACRQLGYKSDEATAYGRAKFGQGDSTSPILLDDLRCNGTESSLFNCRNNGIGTHDCSHSEDAGVLCSTWLCNYYAYAKQNTYRRVQKTVRAIRNNSK